MDNEMKLRRKQKLVAAQVIGVMIGVVIALTHSTSFVTFVQCMLLYPAAFVAAFRLSVYVYQLFRFELAKKIYDDSGNIYIIPRPVWGLVFGVIPLIVLSNCRSLLPELKWYGSIASAVILFVLDIVLFHRDLKCVRAYPGAEQEAADNDTEHTDNPYFELLEIAQTEEELKKMYHEYSKKLHPDVCCDFSEEEATRRQALLNEAFSELRCRF